MNAIDYSAQLKKYTKVENVRPVFDFVTKLVEGYEDKSVYNGKGSLVYRFKCRNLLKDSIQKAIQSCYSGNKLLYQNPLAGSIKFWNRFYADEQIISAKKYPDETLASICNYYLCINRISERIKNKIENDDLPYVYEDICLSISEMTHSNAVYFIFSEDHSEPGIIAQSGYRNNEASGNVCKMMTLFYGKSICTGDSASKGNAACLTEYHSIIKDVDEVNYNSKSYTILSFSIQKHSADTQRNFHIILENEIHPFDEEKILCQISKILFMHERLLNNIQKDYATLLHYRHDVGFIKPICDTSDNAVNILHISDIHITQNKQWDCNSKKVKDIIKHIRNYRKNIDLLAVTGDIVNASNNAIEAQAKYKVAERLLFQIAKELWGYPTTLPLEKRILPNDWKKRIIVTSGNHDYAAMNDVIVQTKSRVTKSAEPSVGNSGTMSKFTYLLEFLQRFLDVPISGLINDNLNELRCYRNLKLNVIVLNTVTPANALQNNKVGLSSAHIEAIHRRLTSGENRNVILAHHAPTYQIDYLEDIYTPYNLFHISKGGDTNIASDMYDAFKTMVQSLTDSSREPKPTNVDKLKTCFEKVKNAIEDYQRSDELTDPDLSKAISLTLELDPGEKPNNNQAQQWIKNLCGSDLYLDIERFLYYEQNGIKNEFSARLLDKLHSINEMQKADYQDLTNNYNTLCRDQRISAVLAGHVHEEKKENYHIKETKTIDVFIAGKLEKNSIRRIRIDKNGDASLS